MKQWRVICVIFVIQIIAMGCKASRQYDDPRNYRGDRNQGSNFHRGSYFYPKRENYRGMLNTRAAPRISNQENFKRQRILSYNPSQTVPGLELGKFKQQENIFSPEVFVPRLPNHYINLHERNLGEKRRRLQRLAPVVNKHRVLNYPIFEGDEPESGSSPVNSYGGLKAEIVFNTVMSDKKYKMMEPVPGQLLFPPKVLSFKTTPPMLRKPTFNGLGSNRINNQRMIPFYAHEAINPWADRFTEPTPALMPWTPSTTIKPYIAHIPFEENRIFATSSTTQFPQIVYAVPYSLYSSNYTTPSSYTGDQHTINSQYSQAKSPKSYRAFWNREDVSIKPVHEDQYDLISTTPTPKRSTEPSNNKQISAPSFLRNHKVESTTPLSTYRIDTFTTLSTTESPQPADLWSDHSEKIHKKVLSTMQGGFKSCYPLQVYTLNKLLQKDRDKNTAQSDQNKDLSPNDIITDGVFSEDSEIQTPKRARHVSNDPTTVPVEPNFDWVEMDPSYQQIGYPTEKYSSQYKFSGFNPMTRKSMPKRNKSEAVLGTQILVQ